MENKMDLNAKWLFQQKAIEKKELVKLSESVITISIDNSGSTEGPRLEVEKAFAKKFINQTTKLIGWNSQATVHETLEKIGATGGTVPQSNLVGLPLISLKKSDTWILLTDGEIGQSDVTMFASQSYLISHIGLNICVLVRELPVKPSDCNVSIFAPLYVANTIVLFYHGGDFNPYVLHVSGTIQDEIKAIVIDNNTKWDDVPTVTFEKLLSLKTKKTDQIPENFVSIGNGFAVNLQLLFAEKLKLDDFINIPINEIIMIAKTTNKLSELRTWCALYKREVKSLTDAINEKYSNESSKTFDKLIKDIVAESDEKVKEKLRDDFNKLNKEVAKNNAITKKVIEQETGKYQVFINLIDRSVADLEKESYNMGTMSICMARRAQRTGIVVVPTEDEIDDLDFNEALVGECYILQDDKPLAILLRKHTKCEENLTDYILNFPLGFGRDNIQIISPDVVSCEVAKYQSKNGIDTTRCEITGFIPAVKMNIKKNASFIFRSLAHNLTDGKILPHVGMLAYATLFEVYKTKDWGKNHPGIKYLMNELLNNVTTTPTFTSLESTSSGVAKVKLAQAMLFVIDKPEYMAQPVDGCRLITETLIEFNLLPDKYDMTALINVNRQRIIRYLIEQYRLRFINATPEEINKMKYKLINDMFVTKYGVPERGTARLVKINECKSLSCFIDDINEDKLMDNIKRMAKAMGVTEAALMPDIVFTEVLYNILKIDKCNLRLDQFMTELQQNKYFNEAYYNILKECLPHINADMFRHVLTKKHEIIPQFMSTLGPSLTTCCCGESFMTELLGKECNLETIVQTCNENRKKHFEVNYNGYRPSSVSGHNNLHRITKSVMDYEFPDAKTIDRKIVLCAAKTMYKEKGMRGNIYSSNFILEIVDCINSYLKVRNDKNYDETKTTRLELELDILNITKSSVGYILPGKIVFPEHILSENRYKLAEELTEEEKLYVNCIA
jgi:hypothetical protein